MATIDELFASPKKYDHPKLRSWLSYKHSPDTVRCHVEFRREREGLSFRPARLYLEAARRDGTTFSDREPWDEELNQELVAHGFAARDESNEVERFGYMLEARLQRLVVRFNDGFFNAVLVQYLKHNGYAADPAILAKLERVREYAPHQGEAASDCAERIENVLGTSAAELSLLGYDTAAGKRILHLAIAYYLDDRFTITNRRQLGWA